MIDEAEIHRMANSADVEERRKAVEQLRDNFAYISDKDTAWSDLIRLIKDDDSFVRLIGTEALNYVFAHISDKATAWSDLIQLTQDENSEVRGMSTKVLGSCFSVVPDKATAWSDLIQLTQDENSEVRMYAAYALSSCFSAVPNKTIAWVDLHRLTHDEDNEVKTWAAYALGSCFSVVPDKTAAWVDLHRLTQDEDSEVRMYAYYSLGSASVYKATKEESEEKFKEYIKIAIDNFKKSSQESTFELLDPASFCLPFYSSYYAIISEKQEAEAEAVKYLDKAKKATGGSESEETLIKAVENLANALKEAQKPLDFSETKEQLSAYRQYCDHTAEIADSARGKSPVAAAAILRGIPIVGMKLKGFIAEIQENANEACRESQGTPTEEIACTVNQEFQKRYISDQNDLTHNVENMIFILKSKIPQIPQNKHIHEEIEKLREEYDMAKHYGMVPLIIALIPTASVHTGDVINAEVMASDDSQVVVKGNDNKNANDNTHVSKKSLLERINNPATIAAFVGFLCVEIGTYFYPITYNHLISVGIACLAFIIVAVFNKN